jgi:hypothetical protein
MLEVGDLVSSNSGLHSGGSRYAEAVLASLEPLILVSTYGDMRWSCLELSALFKTGTATAKHLEVALDRLKGDNYETSILEPLEKRLEQVAAIEEILSNLSVSVALDKDDDSVSVKVRLSLGDTTLSETSDSLRL